MIFLDFEVFTDDEYRLSKGGMTTEDFIRDPRFQPTMLSIAENDRAPQSAAGPDAIDELLAARDWSRETVVIHNSMFDAGILAFRYGIVPFFIIDTLCICARHVWFDRKCRPSRFG
jgi:hypothetical protein